MSTENDIAKDLKRIYQEDKHLLEKTQVPIITVSATFTEDLKGLHHLKETDNKTDIVLSRAHYSMALAAAVEAWGNKIDPKKAWLVDSTNYVSTQDYKGVQLTNMIGKVIARWPMLKAFKDVVDKFGRSKMPILDNVTPPTLYLCSNINKPILSFHIVTGNILANEGKSVVQMITDPHVREDYLENAQRKNMRFLVFDEKTKEDFFKLAKKIGKRIPKDQLESKVTVTGPSVDPRVVACNKEKTPWSKGTELKICLTTGGLGTNKTEIKAILEQLLPELKKQASQEKTELPAAKLFYYAGTHKDHLDMAVQIAKENNLLYQIISPKDPANFEIDHDIQRKTNDEKDAKKAKLIIIYHPQIVDANELLIRHGFPSAHVFISKPSGDMAYDAVASGAALLTLKEWGEWEFNVRAVFEKNGTAQKANVEDIVKQLIDITQSNDHSFVSSKFKSSAQPVPSLSDKAQKSWLEQAMDNAKKIDKNILEGTKNILRAVKSA